MKVIDLKTNLEIKPVCSRSTGTDMLMQLLFCNPSRVLNSIQFGTTSRGYITYPYGETIVFNNCTFNYTNFSKSCNIQFNNCTFNKCLFDSCFNIGFEDCSGELNFCWEDYLQGFLNIKDCDFNRGNHYGYNHGIVSDINITNCPNFSYLEEAAEKIKEEAELQKELMKNFKYGYKVVNVPVLIKLSFPEDAQIVNLNKPKSRASKAFVESIHILNKFEGEGVTNTDYSPICEYRVGQEVIPDKFDASPKEDCGHGIHFCKNIKDVPAYASIPIELRSELEKYV